MKITLKSKTRNRRHRRIRAKIFGTAKVPRLIVFRSNKHIYCQLVNDETGSTLAAASDLELKGNVKKQSKVTGNNKKKGEKEKIIRTKKAAEAYEVGKLVAQKALKKKIKKIVFDRGGYKYHGRVKALAEGAREGGLSF